MNAVTFQIHTEQPLLATSFQGDPNSDVSYSYIPGSMIRGALIGRYLKQPELQNVDIVENEQARQLFFDATTRYLNAYLSTQEPRQLRSLPVPRSWHQEKGAEVPMQLYDFSQVTPTQELTNPKKIGQGFCTVRGNSVQLFYEKRRINVHHQRDRKLGRATAKNGQIFRYEAIDTGQTFQAVILFDNSTNAERVVNLLNENSQLWLGGSQSAGYGQVKISDVAPDENWKEVEEAPADRIKYMKTHPYLVVTLLSDLILRNRWGQYTIEPPIQALTKALGLPEPLSLVENKSFVSSTLIGGFNRKWGLPLPQVQAIAAGSVFVFEAVSLAPEQIQKVEFQGIGERLNEGFGRIAINWLGKARLWAEKPNATSGSNVDPLKGSGRDLAQEMAKRLMRQRLEEWLIQKASILEVDGKISNSQLSRLGLIARKALNERNPDLVSELLNNLPSNAKKQFEKATIAKKSLKDVIQGWLNPEKRMDLFGRISDITVADQTFSLNDELATEYSLRLIMAIAKKTSKERSHESRSA